jgi:hypothetical protein
MSWSDARRPRPGGMTSSRSRGLRKSCGLRSAGGGGGVASATFATTTSRPRATTSIGTASAIRALVNARESPGIAGIDLCRGDVGETLRFETTTRPMSWWSSDPKQAPPSHQAGTTRERKSYDSRQHRVPRDAATIAPGSIVTSKPSQHEPQFTTRSRPPGAGDYGPRAQYGLLISSHAGSSSSSVSVSWRGETRLHAKARHVSRRILTDEDHGPRQACGALPPGLGCGTGSVERDPR